MNLGKPFRRVRVSLVAALSVGFLVGLFGGVAHAATTSGSQKIFSVAGNSYGNQAALSTNSTYRAATSFTWRVANAYEPAGELGALARVYWDGGVLCKSTSWRYNTASANSFQTSYRDHGCGGWIYSRGRSAVWDGNSYDRRDTYSTVNLYG